MSLWILDTDHISLLQRNHPNVKQRLTSIDPNKIFVTVITFEEQMRGRLNQVKQAKSQESLISAYNALRETIEDYKRLNLLDFDKDAYSCHMNLLRQKIRIGSQDLRIAAIALSVDGIVVTRNQKDFEKVPNLKIEDWTLES
ncbi:MAG: type II toxin-antitoxin system VapC family toxin [Pseudanabaena sp.]|jgi:tRNA(fMet)-specific endonuclease VapC